MTDRFLFRVEWLDAPGVRHSVLAKTWSDISILFGEEALTRFAQRASQSVRDSVTGSAFPLARWIVENWWSITNESARSHAMFEGARQSGTVHREWMARHNLLYAREGMALPDLTLFQDGDAACLLWKSDPSGGHTPGRFFEEGRATVAKSSFQKGLTDFVNVVLDRTRDLADDEEVLAVRENWIQIQNDSGDLGLAAECRLLGALGLDPYVESSYKDVPKALIARLQQLREPIRQDVVRAATATRLDEAVSLVESMVKALGLDNTSLALADLGTVEHHLSHQAGYRRARAVRARLGLKPTAPIFDLPRAINRSLGPLNFDWIDEGRHVVDALVDSARVVAISPRRETAKRFLIARALHHALFLARGSGRLVSSAVDADQRASRAFAAELLAPAAGIDPKGDYDEHWDDEMAEQFGVSSKLIEHQLTNHGLR